MKFYPTDTFSYKSFVYGFFSLYILVAAVCWDMNTASTHAKNSCCSVKHTCCEQKGTCEADKQKTSGTEKDKKTPCCPCNNTQNTTTPIIFWYEHSTAYQVRKKYKIRHFNKNNDQYFVVNYEKNKLIALPAHPSRTAGKDRLKQIHCWRV